MNQQEIDTETCKRFVHYLINTSGNINGALAWINQAILSHINFSGFLRKKSKWKTEEIKNKLVKDLYPLKYMKEYIKSLPA